MSGSVPPLRVGFIGLGKMGLHHLKAAEASGMAHVVGVADPTASREELAARLPGDAIITASATEMLAQARPDVVHIVTPPGSHAALALEALRAGCHVYVEKPFTPTAAEAESVLALAAEKGLKVCAGHQVLFEAPALAAREALPSIGRLTHIESYFSFKTVRRTITPTDQAIDILPHAVYPVVDQLRTAAGLAGEIEIDGVSLDATGEVYALLRLGTTRAVVMVTLNGRPVEQYQVLVGTNGSLRADYIGGFMDALVGPGTGPGVLLTPFRRSLHATTGTVRGIVRLLRGGSYPGLRTLVLRFYTSIRDGAPSPVSPGSIRDTVAICEAIGARLRASEAAFEREAQARLDEREALLPPPRAGAPGVLVTGGTGLLGTALVQELRRSGHPVRVLARRVPPASRRLPGIEYRPADLASPLDASLFAGIRYVVHAAAETAGGVAEHRRNSLDATRHVLEASARAGVDGVVHVSSLAVLKTSREMGTALDESTPIEESQKRGPYVWGKAASEVLAHELSRTLGVPLRIIRPGPLVDFAAYQPPGRLGRELGPVFVAIGPKHGPLSVCDVHTAARVVRSYLADFAQAPPLLNMVEAPPPTRADLMARYRSQRPDLSVFWFPAWLLRAMSGPMKLAQRWLMGAKEPIDIAAAFASEAYRTDLAAQVIARADARPEAQGS